MTTLRAPGTEDMLSGVSGLADQRRYGMKVTQKKAYRIEGGRAAEKSAEVQDARADDVIEIELEGGLKLWTNVERFEKDFGRKVRGEEGVLTVPAELSLGGPSRGWGGWVLKGLRLFNVDLAGMAANKIAEKLEDRITPGIYRCLPGDTFALGPGKKPVYRKAIQSSFLSMAPHRAPRAASVDSGESQTDRFDGLFSSNTMTTSTPSSTAPSPRAPWRTEGRF